MTDELLERIDRVVNDMEKQKVSKISTEGVIGMLDLDTPVPQLEAIVAEYLHQRYDPIERATRKYKNPVERADALRRHADALRRDHTA